MKTIKETIRTSYQSMTEKLSDVKNNIPLSEDDFPKTDSEAKCGYCVFYEMCHEDKNMLA